MIVIFKKRRRTTWTRTDFLTACTLYSVLCLCSNTQRIAVKGNIKRMYLAHEQEAWMIKSMSDSSNKCTQRLHTKSEFLMVHSEALQCDPASSNRDFSIDFSLKKQTNKKKNRLIWSEKQFYLSSFQPEKTWLKHVNKQKTIFCSEWSSLTKNWCLICCTKKKMWTFKQAVIKLRTGRFLL